MECYCHLRNIQDLMSDGKTPYERRFGEPFEGPIIPFGSMIEYHPITAKDFSRLHQFGKKVLPGIFLCYVLYAEGIWKGDVADIEELERMDVSDIHGERLNAKEVLTPKIGEHSYILNCRWKGKTIWRRSGSENIHLDPGQSRPRRRAERSLGRIRRVSTTTRR